MEAENKVSVLQLILLNSCYWYLREGKSVGESVDIQRNQTGPCAFDTVVVTTYLTFLIWPVTREA
jgi:hypothetical protein